MWPRDQFARSFPSVACRIVEGAVSKVCDTQSCWCAVVCDVAGVCVQPSAATVDDCCSSSSTKHYTTGHWRVLAPHWSTLRACARAPETCCGPGFYGNERDTPSGGRLALSCHVSRQAACRLLCHGRYSRGACGRVHVARVRERCVGRRPRCRPQCRPALATLPTTPCRLFYYSTVNKGLCEQSVRMHARARHVIHSQTQAAKQVYT